MLVTIILLQNFIAALYAVYNRKVASKSRDLYWHQTAAVFGILYAFALLYALPRHLVSFSDGAHQLPFLILNGFCFGIGTGIAYIAFRDQEAAVVNTNLLWKIPVAAFLAVVILDQSFAWANVLGSALIILSVCIASMSSVSKMSSWKPSKATVMALVAGSLFGIGIVSEKITLNHMNVDTFIVMSWPSEFLWLLIPTLWNIHLWKKVTSPKVLRPTLIMGILRFIAGLMFIWALENATNTTLVTASGGLQTILTVIIAAVVLNETKHIIYKSLAAVIAAVGIVILFIN
jgi:drug/metabolite transporter (DMT)-like permease